MTTNPRSRPEGKAGDDRVFANRARIDRLARLGKAVGYSCLLVSMAAFALGATEGFTPVTVGVVVVALAVGSGVLLPSIIVGYGIRAAEREERGGGSFH